VQVTLQKYARESEFLALGYAGLPMALAFGAAGCETTGFDVDLSTIAALPLAESYISVL